MRVPAGALLLLLSCASALAQTVPPEAAKCQGCHDTAGPSIIPRLNGQRANYILQRLVEFHDPASQTPHATYFMWDISSSLGMAKARAFANYFASLPATSAKPSGQQATAGDKFYHGEGGCQTCHGPEAAGAGMVLRGSPVSTISI